MIVKEMYDHRAAEQLIHVREASVLQIFVPTKNRRRPQRILSSNLHASPPRWVTDDSVVPGTLRAQLNEGLRGVSLLGNDPLLLQESQDAVRQVAAAQGFEEHHFFH